MEAIALFIFGLIGFTLGLLLGKIDRVSMERTGNYLAELLNPKG